ncbi:hypothetical protein [Nocardia sp. NPDC052316]|uniref:hypothetical protein n=1 Tax=Nocardia sp. NPDC052316 TaxID=3364329 RepID=UPI0037C72EB6
MRFYRFGILPLEATPVIWTAAVVLYIFFPPVLPRYGKWVWGTVAAVLTLVTVPVWVLTAFAASVDRGEVEAVAVSPDGRHEAVAVSYSGFDSGCRVWLRERGGPFSKQALVWEETEGYCPARVSFAGATAISVTESDGRKTLATTFDPHRMSVEVVLRS